MPPRAWLRKKYRPKSKRLAEIGAPSTSKWRSSRCQPRGRTSRVATSSFRAYRFSPPSPVGTAREIVRSSASVRLTWPSRQFCHVGEFESSKSAMNIFAPELRALITIFRSTGPVISTRRSCSSAGTGATRQSPSRTSRVSGRKSGSSPARSRPARACRAASSSRRRGPKRRSRSVRNSTASGVSTSFHPRTSTAPGENVLRRRLGDCACARCPALYPALHPALGEVR